MAHIVTVLGDDLDMRRRLGGLNTSCGATNTTSPEWITATIQHEITNQPIRAPYYHFIDQSEFSISITTQLTNQSSVLPLHGPIRGQYLPAAVQSEIAAGGEVAAETRDQESSNTEEEDVPPAELWSQVTGVHWSLLDVHQVLDDVIITVLVTSLCSVVSNVRFSAHKRRHIEFENLLIQERRQLIIEVSLVQTVLIQ